MLLLLLAVLVRLSRGGVDDECHAMSCYFMSFPSQTYVCMYNAQIGDLVRLLRGDEGGLRMFESYPVVTGLDGMAFVGTVSRKDLVRERQREREKKKKKTCNIRIS